MEVRSGYAQTEVGVIPLDWEVKSIRELAQIKTGPFGTVLKASEYAGTEGVPLISVGEVGKGCFKITPHTPLVPATVVRRLPQYVLRTGDIVFGRKGAVERSALITEREDGWFLGSDGIGVRPKPECFPPYLACQFQRHAVQTWLMQNAAGTTMPSLNQAILGNVQIPYASLPEQKAIASALSDVDALLSTLDRLIAKKRDLKLAAMQQLLTGQTRLPGFHGEWDVKQLSDVLTICHGKSQHEVVVAGGPYPILATGGQIGTASRPLYDKPSVLIGRKGTINQPQYMDTPFWTVDTLFYSSMKGNNSAKFFYYRFCLIDWMQFNEASGVPSLNARTIERIEVSSPDSAEQAAIATVLSDMDTELTALEARRDKTRALKQAMMQELLTGKTRLLIAEVETS